MKNEVVNAESFQSGGVAYMRSVNALFDLKRILAVISFTPL